ncbi:MAG: DNA-protecting protein DprA [Planctomycetes bacterium]|nr:DNA-protecting protein DprA [Planctomycetota bacterium]MCP4839025.1 DNA-protecting protein DprA [Planctomycetota bacterium]
MPAYEHTGPPRSSNEDDAWLRLTAAVGLGPHTIRRLLAAYGTASDIVIAASQGDLDALDDDLASRCGGTIAAAIRRSDPQGELDRLHRIGGCLVPFDDPRYPRPLLQIPDPPPLLRVAGDVERLCDIGVAVVGTRRCGATGLQQAARFAGALTAAGLTIVSGGARGIDAEAHRAVLRTGGRTVVVLGSGLGCPYPPEHASLFDDVRGGGGLLVSELPTSQPPRPSQFPRRNRIISGLSRGVLVVEAPTRSGAMLTARLAVEQHGRDCWVVAAGAERLRARGGMEAVRDGWAACALDPGDVLADVLGRDAPASGPSDEPGPTPLPALDVAQRNVIDGLRRGGAPLPSLIEVSGGSPAAALQALTHLELLGLVARSSDLVRLTPTGVAVAAAIRRGDEGE